MNWTLETIPDDHPTPSVIISESIAEKNIRSMQAYCDQHRLKLRPHTKTHKSIWMAERQMRAGACGLTVAKAGEAEVMSSVCDDILIAYPAMGASRIARVTELAKRVRVSVGIDSRDAAEHLQNAAAAKGICLGILVDVEVGFHRTGVASCESAIRLCEYLSNQKNLYLRGLMCFPGHILPGAPDERWLEYEQALGAILDGLKAKGISVETVSGGSTPTARESHRNRYLNEIRPGTYVYNDVNEVRLGVCDWDDCAARVLVTVVSMPESNKIVVDGGSKTLSSDRNAANPDAGFGFVVGYPSAKITRLSEEHGEIHIPDIDLEAKALPKIGDRLWIIPNHICVCINLQNQFYLQDSENRLVEMPVNARGLLV
jgi:D-serine deaminase-like pyridoxal phosphate-dependent protein